MTVELQAVFSAETRILTDITRFAISVAISSAQAKTGSYSYDLGFQTGPFGKRLTTASAAVRIGYWLYMANTTINDDAAIYYAGHGVNNNGLAFSDTANAIFLEIDTSSGEIYLRRPVANNTIETLAAAPIPAQFATSGTWFHVGVNHFVDSINGVLSLYIDGTRILHYEGDTRPCHWNGSGLTFRDTVLNVLGPGAAGTSGVQGFSNAFVDDMFIETIVGELDLPVPARRYLLALPDGAGADDDWTPDSGSNYQMVDDNPNDGDATKNKALSVDLRDTFTYSNITLPADHRIVSVIPSVFAKRLDSALDHEISVHAWDGATYGDSDDLDMNMGFDTPVVARLSLQPDGSAWNETDFNAMQFGYRSRGDF